MVVEDFEIIEVGRRCLLSLLKLVINKNLSDGKNGLKIILRKKEYII
jgi:hypothetical protein